MVGGGGGEGRTEVIRVIGVLVVVVVVVVVVAGWGEGVDGFACWGGWRFDLMMSLHCCV